jgi:dsRNA-specific ribonuclease
MGWNLTIPKDMADAIAYYTAVYYDEDFNKAEEFLKKYVQKYVGKTKVKEFCIEILNTPATRQYN